MNFKDCPLRHELKEGLEVYERETNLSPLSLIESLVERYLYDEGYLVTGAEYEEVAFPTELNNVSTYLHITENGRYRIRRKIGKRMEGFGTYDYEVAEEVCKFLEEKNWDIKYTNSQTKLTGKDHEMFVLNEMQKDGEGMKGWLRQHLK